MLANTEFVNNLNKNDDIHRIAVCTARMHRLELPVVHGWTHVWSKHMANLNPNPHVWSSNIFEEQYYIYG